MKLGSCVCQCVYIGIEQSESQAGAKGWHDVPSCRVFLPLTCYWFHRISFIRTRCVHAVATLGHFEISAMAPVARIRSEDKSVAHFSGETGASAARMCFKLGHGCMDASFQ